MPEAPITAERFRLSSSDYTGPDKADAVRELFGRTLMRVDLWACEGALPLDFTVSVIPLGSEAVYTHGTHTPAHLWRSPALMRDGADDLFLTTTQAGCIMRTEHGDEVIPAGRYVLHSQARAHQFIHTRGGRAATLKLPHAALAQRVPGLDEAPLRLLPRSMLEPALAMGYAQLLADMPHDPALSAPLLQIAQSHLLELMAHMLTPAGHGVQPPESNAHHVPRLALIRRDILARINQHELSLTQIAHRHHLTPRQVQRLFAREGTCFSDFVRDARLDRVRAALADPLQQHRLVLQIVQDNGFDDFSAFSRAFKRRFGMTPTEVRSAG
ncbi:AraC family transcriptional regulator [Ottowia sp. VDI28]|uniref:AraC family transcriptional regulator n=1 Tax=Ottowia sp. VDI28 TaxID=3133968 RepID=UPI003C303513